MSRTKLDLNKSINSFKKINELVSSPNGVTKDQIIDTCIQQGFGRNSYFTKFIIKFYNHTFGTKFVKQNGKYRLHGNINLIDSDYENLTCNFALFIDDKLFGVDKPNEQPKSELNKLELGSQVFIMHNNNIAQGKIIGMCYADDTESEVQYTIRLCKTTVETCFGFEIFRTVQDLLNNLVTTFKSK